MRLPSVLVATLMLGTDGSAQPADGTIATLADRYQGKRLNSPNDLAQAPEGSIYFTDPPYGLPQQQEGKELEVNGVYRLEPSGTLTLLASDFERPNGLGFSPDHQTLSVADTARQHVRAFDVQNDGRLANGRVFGEMKPWPGAQGGPDGLKVDTRGHVFVTGAGGVWVFGDADDKTLYITARTSVYRIRLR